MRTKLAESTPENIVYYQTVRGNTEKAESELEGRLLRVHLTVK